MGNEEHLEPPLVWREAKPLEALCTHITIDSPAPISINRAYAIYQGRRILTTAGREYKDAIRSKVAQASYQWKAAVNGIYDEGGYVQLYITLYLARLFNGSWSPGSMTTPKLNKKTGKTPKSKRRNPYQSIDGGNYLKLLEDGVVNGCGIDDACHLDLHIYKREDTKHPRVEVIHRVMIPT